MSDRGGITQDVLLRIRATNQATADFRSIEAAIKGVAEALDAQTAAAARGEVKERELAATTRQMAAALNELKRLAGQVETYSNFEKVIAGAQRSLDGARTALDKYQTSAMSAGVVTQAQAEKINQLTASVTKHEQNLVKTEKSYADLGAQLRKAGIDTSNLTAAVQQMGAAFDTGQHVVQTLSNAQLNYAANTKTATAATEAQKAAEEALRAEQEKRAQAGRDAAGRLQAAQGEGQAAREARAKELEASAASARARVAGEREAAEVTARLQKDNAESAERYLQKQRQQRMAAIREEISADLRASNEKRDAAQKAITDAADAARKRDREALDRFYKWRDERIAGTKKVAEEEAKPVVRAGLPEQTRRTDALGRVGRGEGQQAGLFGLRPYEWTNFGYQINDITTGLASGQHAAQIFAQQGLQIVQIFGTRLLPILPQVTLAVTALTVAFGALGRAFREVESIRDFRAEMTSNVNAVGYNIDNLVKIQKQIRDMGVSWSDAGKMIKTAMADAVGEGRIAQMAQLAEDIHKRYGTDVVEAMQKAVRAFDGTSDSIAKFAATHNLLDAPSLNRIRNLIAEGHAQEAMTFALDRMSERMRGAAKEGASPLDETIKNLRNTWDNLMVTLSKSEFAQAVVRGFDRVIGKVNETITGLDDLIKKWNDWKKTSETTTQPVLERGLIPEYIKAAREIGEEDDARRARGEKGLTFTERLAAAWKRVEENAQKAGEAIGNVPSGGTVPAANLPALSGESRFSAGKLPVDTETLKTLARLLAEASQSLPAGYRVEAISTERPGATVRGTGQLSEHGFGRAIDVRIVDAAGNAVPGSMGRPTELYTQLDAAMAAAAKKYGVGPLAVGSTFGSRPDAGHYSLYGSEAVQNAARRGVATLGALGTPQPAGTGPVKTGPTEEQKADRDKELIASREQERIDRAATREAARQAELAKVTREEREKAGTAAQQNEAIARRMSAFDVKQLTETLAEESERQRERIDNVKHYQEAAVAAEKAVADARARNANLNYQEIDTIRKRAFAAETDRLNRLDQEQERLKGLQRTVAGLQRGLDTKNSTELAKALEAVELKYQGIYDQQKKVEEQATDATRAQVQAQTALIKQAEEREKAEAAIESARKQAQISVQTRSTIESTYQKLIEDGQISIQEGQDKIREGYEATAPAIQAAIDKLKELVATNENLSPERVAEYTAEIKKLESEIKYVDPEIKGLKKTISESITDNASKAFDTVAEAIGGVIAKTKSWKDVWTSLRTAAGEFFAGVLKDIATYIIKAQLAKAVSSFMPGLNLGGLFGTGTTAAAGGAATAAAPAATSTALVAVVHGGGVIGNDNLPMRRAPAHWFANAPRYHKGYVVGLNPDERAAILQKGEEVVTADNPRHVRNWAAAKPTQQNMNIRNVLVMDEQMIPQAMAGSHGERTTMAHVTKNIATIRQMVR